jgi:hypothetical protein
MSACPYCYAAIKWVTDDRDPRRRIAVDPLPVLHPGPGDALVVAIMREPVTRGASLTRIGHPIGRGDPAPVGYLTYVDHLALCEQLAPDHPRRPRRTTDSLF